MRNFTRASVPEVWLTSRCSSRTPRVSGRRSASAATPRADARGSSRPWYARTRPWRSPLNGRSLDGSGMTYWLSRGVVVAIVTLPVAFISGGVRPLLGVAFFITASCALVINAPTAERRYRWAERDDVGLVGCG